MKTNIHLRQLVASLRKAKTPLWSRIAQELEKPTRAQPSINIMKLNRVVREGETAVVPGKVLSVGDLSRPMTVAAFHFSEAARAKINEKGKALSIAELLEQNPKGSKVRIVK